MKEYYEQETDVVVIGAGHAGCEAALAASRLGKKCLLFSMSLDQIADLPCNPNIGGTGKGHLVREVDALGGQMGLVIDQTFIQSRMLNLSKGPAIHSLRVQADKRRYHEEMKRVLENEPNLGIVEAEVTDIVVEDGVVKAVKTLTGAVYPTKAVIVATGTYLQGLIMIGELQYPSGPHNTRPSTYLSSCLTRLGVPLRRFKTGTPARVHRDSLHYEKMERQPGDEEIVPFSFMNEGHDLGREQVDCYLTYTTSETKEIILKNLSRSPMYAGTVKGVGPRYCPSIEDKVVRFPDRDAHQAFIEPEGLSTKEMYVSGISSTLPEEVQKELYRTIIGLEDVVFMRPAYGIEYDAIDATVLKRTLEHLNIKNLFFAGQINGSSGYEEAAAQGLVAGINAALNIDQKEPFILDRSDAYIGVLIDDLVTKGTNEPYRMMTSRSEYRLTLRQDNADLRLTERAYRLGLASKERYHRMCAKREAVEAEKNRLAHIMMTPKEHTNAILTALGSSPIKTGISLLELVRRPELNYDLLAPLDPDRPSLSRESRLQVETQIKYEGYIQKQMQQIAQFKRLEHKKIEHIEDFSVIKGLSNEAIQKLNQIRPESLGQASRISGVSPADINVLLIHLETERRNRHA